jgi:hypothetical protein
VYYEFSTAIQAYSLLQQAEKTGNQPLINIALETFLLHYRNLRHFLNPRDPVYADDILAEDFFAATVVPPEFEHQPGKRMDDLTTKLNKQLAHLSYTRLDYEGKPEKKWNASELLRAAVEGLLRFISSLPSEHKCWFARTAAMCNKVKFQ